MPQSSPIKLAYFSDVLCVWAYIAQARVDELLRAFGAQVQIAYHFIPVFGVVEERVGQGWKDRGGYQGYSDHVRAMARTFTHVEVSQTVWLGDVPQSSANAHLFLKAVERLTARGAIGNTPAAGGARAPFEDILWRLRVAFFRDGRNVARRGVQLEIAEEAGVAGELILDEIDNGAAMASLCRDLDLCREYGVGGSPTYVLNEGRQKLYGNVGYKIIAANVQEILAQPESPASWC